MPRARMPRSYLRLNPDDLLPGETGVLREFGIVIDSERRVYVNKTVQMVRVLGFDQKDEWARHGQEGVALLRRESDGSLTLIFPKDHRWLTHKPLEMDRVSLIPVENLEFILPEQECDKCKGAGYLRST